MPSMGQTQHEEEERRAQALAAAERCIAHLKGHYGVKRVFIFGSAAGEGPWHTGSDLDLAVEGLASEDFWSAWAELDRLVPPWLEVDLFPLERAYPEVQAHILGEVKMTKDPYGALQGRIAEELNSLRRVVDEADQLLAQVPAEPTFVERRAAGSIVEDFYTGCERIFERVAVYLDGGVPTGEQWHEQLLRQMAAPGPRGRPAVLSSGLIGRLDAYRRFRHRARHIYGFELDWGKVQELADGMRSLYKRVMDELASFGRWLQARVEKEG